MTKGRLALLLQRRYRVAVNMPEQYQQLLALLVWKGGKQTQDQEWVYQFSFSFLLLQTFPGHWSWALSSINNIFLSERSTIQLEDWDTSGFWIQWELIEQRPHHKRPILYWKIGCSSPSFKKSKWNVMNQHAIRMALHCCKNNQSIYFQT